MFGLTFTNAYTCFLYQFVQRLPVSTFSNRLMCPPVSLRILSTIEPERSTVNPTSAFPSLKCIRSGIVADVLLPLARFSALAISPCLSNCGSLNVRGRANLILRHPSL